MKTNIEPTRERWIEVLNGVDGCLKSFSIIVNGEPVEIFCSARGPVDCREYLGAIPVEEGGECRHPKTRSGELEK